MPISQRSRPTEFSKNFEMCQKQDLMYKLREKTHSQSIAHCSNAIKRNKHIAKANINAFRAMTFQSMSHCHTCHKQQAFSYSHLKGKKIGMTIHSKYSSIFLWYGILSKKVKCPKDNSSNRFCRFQRYPLHKGISHWSFLLRLTM